MVSPSTIRVTVQGKVSRTGRLGPESVSGVAGAATGPLVASVLVLFRLLDVRTGTYVWLNVPLAAQEIVLAFWLIARGFNPVILEAV